MMLIQTHTSVVLQTENSKPPAKAVVFACSEAVVNKPDRNLFWVSLSSFTPLPWNSEKRRNFPVFHKLGTGGERCAEERSDLTINDPPAVGDTLTCETPARDGERKTAGCTPGCDAGNWWGGKREMTPLYKIRNYTQLLSHANHHLQNDSWPRGMKLSRA